MAVSAGEALAVANAGAVAVAKAEPVEPPARRRADPRLRHLGRPHHPPSGDEQQDEHEGGRESLDARHGRSYR